jgi:hypothetical protein
VPPFVFVAFTVGFFPTFTCKNVAQSTFQSLSEMVLDHRQIIKQDYTLENFTKILNISPVAVSYNKENTEFLGGETRQKNMFSSLLQTLDLEDFVTAVGIITTWNLLVLKCAVEIKSRIILKLKAVGLTTQGNVSKHQGSTQHPSLSGFVLHLRFPSNFRFTCHCFLRRDFTTLLSTLHTRHSC